MRAHCAVAVCLLLGCGSTAPTERQESTAASIRAAEEVGARKVPEANLHLQLALEQSEHARQLMANGDKERAQALLMRAEADAALALALARESAERHEAEVAMAKVQELKSQQ